MNYCTECGAEVEGSETYCPECGSIINEPATTDESTQEKGGEEGDEDVPGETYGDVSNTKGDQEGDEAWDDDETNRALAWFFSAIWIIFGLAFLFATVVGGILMIVAGLIAIPRVHNRLGWNISAAGVAAILILSMVGAGVMLPSENVETDTQPSDGATEPDATPPSGDTSGDSSADQDRLFSDSISVGVLSTAVSDSGKYILYGDENGGLHRYSEDGSSETVSLRAGSRGVANSYINNDGDMTALWMDDGRFGGTVPENWVVDFTGVWDVSVSDDLSSTSAVTAPSEGAGSVGYVQNGDIQWSKNLGESMSQSVAMTDDGQYVAVGAVQHWGPDGVDLIGESSVQMYDSDGNLEWEYETDVDVISVAIDGEQERVIAGTDDYRLLVLDFDGNLVWEENQRGGFVYLSDDGSTIISSSVSDLYAFSLDGEQLWSVSVDEIGTMLVKEDISISDDGERVLYSSRGSESTVSVIEQGEIIWQREYTQGPATGAISGDGETWSIAGRDNSDNSGMIEAYRRP